MAEKEHVKKVTPVLVYCSVALGKGYSFKGVRIIDDCLVLYDGFVCSWLQY